MYKTTLKWWLIFVTVVSVATAGFFTFDQEPILEFASSAGMLGTCICALIAIIWIWKNVTCLYESVQLDGLRRDFWNTSKGNSTKLLSLLDQMKKCKTTTESGWFWAEQCMSLGMVGTVVGFMMSLTGFAGADISNPAAVQQLIVSMGAGLSVALFTTIFGLIASLLIKVQYFILENDIDEEVTRGKKITKGI